MKEIGEVLKESREQNGVSIEEAAEDLNYKVSQLEAIESGNYKTFKDIFLLKCMITDYAKYLGLNSEQIIDEFNEYVFESTSKIPIDDIEKASKSKEKEDKIASPYTKEEKEKSKLPLILIIILVVLIAVFVGVTAYNNSKNSNSSDNIKISDDIDYARVPNLAKEAVQKLNEIKPISIGQALRISGVNPADITMLILYLKRGKNE